VVQGDILGEWDPTPSRCSPRSPHRPLRDLQEGVTLNDEWTR